MNFLITWAFIAFIAFAFIKILVLFETWNKEY